MSVGRKAPGFNAVYLGDAAELALHQGKQKQLSPEDFSKWTLARIAELATTQPTIRQQLEKLATEADRSLELAMSAATDAMEAAQRQVDAAEAQLTTYQQLLGRCSHPTWSELHQTYLADPELHQVAEELHQILEADRHAKRGHDEYSPVARDRQAERQHCEATIPGYTEARAMPLPVVVSLEQRTMSLPQRRRRSNAR